jgi:hypothetical protein
MKKALLLFGAVVLLVFALSGVALAATSQDIYDDYADNGKLDGTYTDAELRAYLADATLHQYGDPKVVDPLDQLVNELLGRDNFPFTGFQLALVAVGAVVLIGGGAMLRRATRRRA